MKERNESSQPSILEEAAERFLWDGEPRKITFDFSREHLERLRRVAERNGLTEDEALRMVLGAGLAHFTTGNGSDTKSDRTQQDQLTRMRSDFMSLEANYAVMKHRLWLALQDNQTMSLRDGALSATIKGLKGVIDRLKAELAEARAQPISSNAGEENDDAAPSVEAARGGSSGLLRHVLNFLRQER